MPRPVLPTINVGSSGWGPLVTQALAQVYTTPYPLPEHVGDESDLPDATIYDRCVVWVEHTELGWVLYHANGGVWLPLMQPPTIALRRWVFEDFYNYSAGSGGAHPFTVTLLASGSAVATALAGMTGAVRIASAASANSGVIARTLDVATILGEPGAACVAIAAYTGAFATASLVRLGFIDTANHADCVDGAYFELASGALAAKTASNSVRTTSGTTFTPLSGVIYRHVIRYVSTTSVRFRIYDHLTGVKVYDQTIATNVATGTSRAFGVGAVATTTTSAAAHHLWVDGMGFGPALPAEFLS